MYAMDSYRKHFDIQLLGFVKFLDAVGDRDFVKFFEI